MDKQKYMNMVSEKKATEGLLLSLSELLSEVIFTGSDEDIKKIEADMLYYRGKVSALSDSIAEAKKEVEPDTLRGWGKEYKEARTHTPSEGV